MGRAIKKAEVTCGCSSSVKFQYSLFDLTVQIMCLYALSKAIKHWNTPFLCIGSQNLLYVISIQESFRITLFDIANQRLTLIYKDNQYLELNLSSSIIRSFIQREHLNPQGSISNMTETTSDKLPTLLNVKQTSQTRTCQCSRSVQYQSPLSNGSPLASTQSIYHESQANKNNSHNA